MQFPFLKWRRTGQRVSRKRCRMIDPVSVVQPVCLYAIVLQQFFVASFQELHILLVNATNKEVVRSPHFLLVVSRHELWPRSRWNVREESRKLTRTRNVRNVGQQRELVMRSWPGHPRFRVLWLVFRRSDAVGGFAGVKRNDD